MLKKFLSRRGLVRKFNKNLKESFLGCTDPNPMSDNWFVAMAESPDAIAGAFTWSASPEGLMFWVDLNDKWLKHLTQKNNGSKN